MLTSHCFCDILSPLLFNFYLNILGVYIYLKWTAEAGFALRHELQVEKFMEAIDKIKHLAIVLILFIFTAFYFTNLELTMYLGWKVPLHLLSRL